MAEPHSGAGITLMAPALQRTDPEETLGFARRRRSRLLAFRRLLEAATKAKRRPKHWVWFDTTPLRKATYVG